jgi:hypothetical protein
VPGFGTKDLEGQQEIAPQKKYYTQKSLPKSIDLRRLFECGILIT